MASQTKTQLEAWLKGFPRDEVENRISDLEQELDRWRKALALHRELESENGAAQGREVGLGEATRQPPNRPEAIRQILREASNQPMGPGSIKEALIERGWLEDDRKQSKRFYAAMYTMTKRGHLLRLHDGRYMLPQGGQGGAPS